MIPTSQWSGSAMLGFGFGFLLVACFAGFLLHGFKRLLATLLFVLVGGVYAVGGLLRLSAEGSAKTTPPTLAESQREAVRRYPELGVKGSRMNEAYLARYRIYKSTRPEYFNDQNWPVNLAEETAPTLHR